MILTLALAAALQEIDNPEYQNWAGCKAGAYVKVTISSDTAGVKNESKSVSKLVEISATKAVVETTLEIPGFSVPGQKRDIPAKVKKPDVVPPANVPNAPKPTEGDEEIELGGKKIKCHWVESITELEGNKTVSRVWTSKEIPGGMAKMTSKTTGTFATTSSMVAAEWKKE